MSTQLMPGCSPPEIVFRKVYCRHHQHIRADSSGLVIAAKAHQLESLLTGAPEVPVLDNLKTGVHGVKPWILARLRDRTFFSLAELRAIMVFLAPMTIERIARSM